MPPVARRRKRALLPGQGRVLATRSGHRLVRPHGRRLGLGKLPPGATSLCLLLALFFVGVRGGTI